MTGIGLGTETVRTHTHQVGTLLAEHQRAAAALVAKTQESAEPVEAAPERLAERYATVLGLSVAIVHKTRLSGHEVSVRTITGEVRDLAPLLVNDMISTGGTIIAAVDALLLAGCLRDVLVVASHALLVGPAVDRLTAASDTLAGVWLMPSAKASAARSTGLNRSLSRNCSTAAILVSEAPAALLPTAFVSIQNGQPTI